MTTNTTQKSGRKRAIIAGGALLGVAALVTTAAFTDFARLNLGGDGGFGGAENNYNLVVSSGQEATVAAVPAEGWIEANPDAANVAPIVGAEALIPGGKSILVNLPVKNDSKSINSSLSLILENTTAENLDPIQAAKDAAYASLMTFEVAQVADATTAPTEWITTTPLAFGTEGSTTVLKLNNLAAQAGDIVVVKVTLKDGATPAETNAANGGGVKVEARFDSSSID